MILQFFGNVIQIPSKKILLSRHYSENHRQAIEEFHPSQKILKTTKNFTKIETKCKTCNTTKQT